MDLSLKAAKKMRLEDFLRQNLDAAPAPRIIEWVDRANGVFRILWTHQSSGTFHHDDAALFRYWAIARGKCSVLSSVELKQSLRMALNKSPSVVRLPHDPNSPDYRFFRFTSWKSGGSASSAIRNCKYESNEMRDTQPFYAAVSSDEMQYLPNPEYMQVDRPSPESCYPHSEINNQQERLGIHIPMAKSLSSDKYKCKTMYADEYSNRRPKPCPLFKPYAMDEAELYSRKEQILGDFDELDNDKTSGNGVFHQTGTLTDSDSNISNAIDMCSRKNINNDQFFQTVHREEQFRVSISESSSSISSSSKDEENIQFTMFSDFQSTSIPQNHLLSNSGPAYDNKYNVMGSFNFLFNEEVSLSSEMKTEPVDFKHVGYQEIFPPRQATMTGNTTVYVPKSEDSSQIGFYESINSPPEFRMSSSDDLSHSPLQAMQNEHKLHTIDSILSCKHSGKLPVAKSNLQLSQTDLDYNNLTSHYNHLKLSYTDVNLPKTDSRLQPTSSCIQYHPIMIDSRQNYSVSSNTGLCNSTDHHPLLNHSGEISCRN